MFWASFVLLFILVLDWMALREPLPELDLATPVPYLQRLNYMLVNVEGAVDRERRERRLALPLRVIEAPFRGLLQRLQKWQLTMTRSASETRLLQYLTLRDLLRDLLEGLARVGMPEEHRAELLSTGRRILQKKWRSLRRALEVDMETTPTVIPTDLDEVLERFMGVPGPQEQQEQQEQEDGEQSQEEMRVFDPADANHVPIDVPLGGSDDEDDDNVNGNFFRPPEVQGSAYWQERWDNGRDLAFDLTPESYHREMYRKPELTATLGFFYQMCIRADSNFWQVERASRDDPEIFAREVMYRLLNSYQQLDLTQGRAYYLTLETERESKSYQVRPQNFNWLLQRFYQHLHYRGLEPVVDTGFMNGSDVENIVVKALPVAKRVRFGTDETIYELGPENRGVIPPRRDYYARGALHPIYNLTRRDNPYGTMRAFISARNLRTLALLGEHVMLQGGQRPPPSLMREQRWEPLRVAPRQTKLGLNLTTTAVGQDQVDPFVVNRRRRQWRPRQGRFFPYFNLTKYDLRRYQIVCTPKELGGKMFDDSCLMYALRMSGQISELEMREIENTIVTREVKPAKLVPFLSAHNLCLQVRMPREDWLALYTSPDFNQWKQKKEGAERQAMPQKSRTKRYGEGQRVIKLFLFLNHFMLDEYTPYRYFSVVHRWDILEQHGSDAMVRPTKCDPATGIHYALNDTFTTARADGRLMRQESKRGMMSGDLVLYLFAEQMRSGQRTKNFQPIYYDDISAVCGVSYKDTSKRRRTEELLQRLETASIEEVQAEQWATLLYSKDSVRPLQEYGGANNNTPSSRKKSLTTLTTLTSPEKTKPTKKKNAKREREERLKELQQVIYYADFETCTTDSQCNRLPAHRPFMVCAKLSKSETDKFVACGEECGLALMEWLWNRTDGKKELPVVYFHNLSYDINFLLKYGVVATVNRNSLILQADFVFRGKNIRLKDSYGLLSMPLRTMARCFKIELEKEIFPYNYYSPERTLEVADGGAWVGDANEAIALNPQWSEDEQMQFLHNLDKLGMPPPTFDMRRYAYFYCARDVDVLQRCVDTFHDQVQEAFDIDCHKVISISSVANLYLSKTVYWPFGLMYQYANHIRDFLLDGVHGGRVMTARNERHHFIAPDGGDSAKGLWDLDAVSLYPSAMSCLYTVGGKPEALGPRELNYEYLEQAFAKLEITAYVVEIYITEIGKPRDFPLVILKDPRTGKITNTNTPPVRMTVCDIELQDLVEFQEIKFHIIRGLKWTGPRDYKLQEVVKDLFDKRAAYKAAKNPLENSYKLILNSIYGKTIQKAISHEYCYYDLYDEAKTQEFQTWVVNHSNFIENICEIKGSRIMRVKQSKPINRHFNNTLLGIQILAMSKRLMNQVMCLADDLHLDVYYQDTDSMHIRRDQVPLLERSFADKYHRPLRGTALCQFHPDFDPICPASKADEVVATESYFLGKKCYIDRLRDQLGNTGFHIRMKGVSQQSIWSAAKRLTNGDILALYRKLFEGETIEFDLCCDGQVKFDNLKDGTVYTKESFIRAVKATAQPERTSFEKRWNLSQDRSLNITECAGILNLNAPEGDDVPTDQLIDMLLDYSDEL